MHPWLVLCSLSDKTSNCTENHVSLERFLRVIGEAVPQALFLSLAQIKLFSILITGYYFPQHNQNEVFTLYIR